MIQTKLNCTERRNEMEEKDSSKEAWNYYKEIYTEKHWPLIKEFNMEEVITCEERNKKKPKEILRYRSYIKKNSSYISVFGSEFSLGGDCDFNFNEKKVHLFQKLIMDFPEHKDKLRRCCSMHHNELNFSLMPTTGAMNNLKGSTYFNSNNIIKYDDFYHASAHDRLDTFIHILNEFYENKDELIFSCSTQNNKGCLHAYLETFKDIYDYCKIVYFIEDRAFVKRLIDNGKKPINSADDLNRYMEIAFNYWKLKKRNITIKHGK